MEMARRKGESGETRAGRVRVCNGFVIEGAVKNGSEIYFLFGRYAIYL
jgi:hypothetical protein